MKTYRKYYKHFYPPGGEWDDILESKDLSYYYSLLIGKFGQEQADIYWNNRDSHKLDYIYQKV